MIKCAVYHFLFFLAFSTKRVREGKTSRSTAGQLATNYDAHSTVYSSDRFVYLKLPTRAKCDDIRVYNK